MAKQPGHTRAGLTRKQMSRAKRETMTQRWILAITGLIIAIVVGVLIFAVINDQILIPNRIIATIKNETITVSQFQDRVLFDTYRNLGQPLADVQAEYITYLTKLSLDTMVDESLIRQKSKEMGLNVSDNEVEEQAQLSFGYDAGEPEPTSTSIATLTKSPKEPTATSTFVYTLTPSPTSTLEPGITPSTTPTETPTLNSESTATLTVTPAPTATPLTEETFNTNFTQALEGISENTGLTTERIEELFYELIRNSLLREKLMEALHIPVDEEKTMIHAAHILVTSEEEAKIILASIKDGEEFEKLAADLSQDKANAYKGGDLGWFGPNEMDPTFEEIAKSTPIGKISDPVQTQSGWHIIKVYARNNVPMTSQEQEYQRQEKFSEMLKQWNEESGVVIESFWADYLPKQLIRATPTPITLPIQQ